MLRDAHQAVYTSRCRRPGHLLTVLSVGYELLNMLHNKPTGGETICHRPSVRRITTQFYNEQ